MHCLWDPQSSKPHSRLVFAIHFFFLEARFYGFYAFSGLVHCLWDPQISFFNETFIKNESYNIIRIFENYFATMFSIFSDKWYPNTL